MATSSSRCWLMIWRIGRGRGDETLDVLRAGFAARLVSAAPVCFVACALSIWTQLANGWLTATPGSGSRRRQPRGPVGMARRHVRRFSRPRYADGPSYRAGVALRARPSLVAAAADTRGEWCGLPHRSRDRRSGLAWYTTSPGMRSARRGGRAWLGSNPVDQHLLDAPASPACASRRRPCVDGDLPDRRRRRGFITDALWCGSRAGCPAGPGSRCNSWRFPPCLVSAAVWVFGSQHAANLELSRWHA